MNVFQRQLLLGNGRTLAEEHNAQGGTVPIAPPHQRVSVEDFQGTTERGDFGIVANVCEVDRLFRLGSKAWIADGTGGEGWHRFKWIAHARGGRLITKWCVTWRFGNFRAAFIPPPLDERITGISGTRGSREEMEAVAKRLNEFAAKERAEHPNRDGQLGVLYESKQPRSAR